MRNVGERSGMAASEFELMELWLQTRVTGSRTVDTTSWRAARLQRGTRCTRWGTRSERARRVVRSKRLCGEEGGRELMEPLLQIFTSWRMRMECSRS